MGLARETRSGLFSSQTVDSTCFIDVFNVTHGYLVSDVHLRRKLVAWLEAFLRTLSLEPDPISP